MHIYTLTGTPTTYALLCRLSTGSRDERRVESVGLPGGSRERCHLWVGVRIPCKERKRMCRLQQNSRTFPSKTVSGKSLSIPRRLRLAASGHGALSERGKVRGVCSFHPGSCRPKTRTRQFPCDNLSAVNSAGALSPGRNANFCRERAPFFGAAGNCDPEIEQTCYVPRSVPCLGKIHLDRRERTWRRLDTCQFKTFIAAPLPRTQCPAADGRA